MIKTAVEDDFTKEEMDALFLEEGTLKPKKKKTVVRPTKKNINLEKASTWYLMKIILIRHKKAIFISLFIIGWTLALIQL